MRAGLQPIRPGEVRNPTGKGGGSMAQWTRKAVRRMLVAEVGDAMPQLREWMQGRAKILIGFHNHAELAETFHEIYERRLDPDASRIPPWSELPQERKDLLINCMRELTGDGLSLREIAVKVGVRAQQAAWEMAAQYGLGSQQANVDDEGHTLPGVVTLPAPEVHRRFTEQQQKQLAAGEVIVDAEYEFVEEDLTAIERGHTEKNDDPGPVVETVHPAIVELVKRRRQLNNNGDKK